MIEYLNGTREMVLTLGADNLNVLNWHFDGSYATHPDMKIHTGGSFTLGQGVIYGKSSK